MRDKTYKKYMNTMQKNLESLLGDKYQNLNISFREVEKLDHGKSYKVNYACFNDKKSNDLLFTIDMDKLFDSFPQNYGYLDRELKSLSIIREKIDGFQNKKPGFDYEVFKSRMILMPCPKDIDESKYPIGNFYGIKTIPCVRKDDGTYSVFEKKIFESISPDQIIHDAVINSAKVMKPYLKEYPSPGQDSDIHLMLLTTESKECGAGVLFLPGMIENIADKEDSSFFVLISSVDEAVIVKESKDMPATRQNVGALYMMNIENQDGRDKSTLTDSIVYHYDSVTKGFEPAIDYVNRIELEKEETTAIPTEAALMDDLSMQSFVL